MKLLEDKILTCGTVLPGNILKVDSFLNHQLDVKFINELGKEIYNSFSSDDITKILTVEASGIALACAAAAYFDVPVVFAKKGHHSNVGSDVYSAEVFSYTKGKQYSVTVSKKFLSPDDNILIIDDFLATGEACLGLKKIVSDAGASLAGVAAAIEKKFQNGGNTLRADGIKVRSLAVIESMTDDSICFGNDGSKK